MLGMPLGDAIGSPNEFHPVTYEDDRPRITDMTYHDGNFGLKPGQWTDDASMGACIADSLLWCQGFDPYDMKVRFLNWWRFGYNNAWVRAKSGPQHSVGLGGNISMSFSEFAKDGSVFTKCGDENTSGNGSVMRNGALAVRYHDDLETGLAVARQQSYLTHQGIEAAECCALLTYVCAKAINNPQMGKVEVLSDLSGFQPKCPSVGYLARSEQEPPAEADQAPDPNRDWRWRAPRYHYAPRRAAMQPGYVGSYAMDAVAMALHCVWTTDNFKDAVLKASNRCGDADSVADVTGQIAGAIYGFQGIPPHWVKILNQWDGNDFAVRAFKLFFKRPARLQKDLPFAPAEAPTPTTAVAVVDGKAQTPTEADGDAA